MARSGIRAIDIMTGEVIIANPNLSVAEAARLMNSFRIGGLPVIEDGELVGMLTERDIMKKVVAVNKKPRDVFVKDIMTTTVITGKLNEDMNSLAMKMAKFDFTRMPIVDDTNKLAGMITNRDILKNSSELVDVLLEQARIKGRLRPRHTAFGRCELCGEGTHLLFKKGKFVCDDCSQRKKF